MSNTILEADTLNDVSLEWAISCLREALMAGQSSEVPFYKRALDHAASVKAGRSMPVTVARRKDRVRRDAVTVAA